MIKLLLFFIACSLSAQTLYVQIGSNNEQLISEFELSLYREILVNGYLITGDVSLADWFLEIELIYSEDIIYSYCIYVMPKNIFSREYITHTWVSFFKDNLGRASAHHIDLLNRIILEYD